MRLNFKKIKSMVVSRSQTYASGYSDLTLDNAELEEIRNLCIFGQIFDSYLTFETHLREVVSTKTRSLCVLHRARNLFNCPCVPMSCFNAYVLSNLEHFAPAWI